MLANVFIFGYNVARSLNKNFSEGVNCRLETLFATAEDDLNGHSLVERVGARPLFHVVRGNFGGERLSKVEAQVESLMTEILQDTAFELVDVEYVKERDWYLRVFVDKAGGIDLDDCQSISEQLSAKLDAADIIGGAYILEVSSPGIDRILKKDRDFVREAGKVVDVTLYAPLDGKKIFVGELEGRDESFLRLKDVAPLPRDKVAQVRLHIDF